MSFRLFVLAAAVLVAGLAAPASAQDIADEWQKHLLDGATAYGLAQMDVATKEIDAAMAIAEKNFVTDDDKMIATLLNVVPLRRVQGKLPEAAALGEQMIARIARRDGSDDSPELMAPLILQAAIYRGMMNWDASDKAYLRTIDLHVKYYGDAHPRTATAMEDRAVMLGKAGRTADGLAVYAEVVDLWVYGFGLNHLREAISRRGYAEALRNAGQPEAATEQERRAAEINAIWNAGR
ncbi:MAG: tetratricopeptide repeat protein [Alphaproteobacteria bacterium]|nr:tetratricopeptide repeat protein [Alphaproteobacteria bacterium]